MRILPIIAALVALVVLAILIHLSGNPDRTPAIVWGGLVGVGMMLLWLYRQRQVRLQLFNQVLRRDPAAIVVFGRLARTSPTPSIEAGFRTTLLGGRGHWEVALSFRAGSFEIWAWDGRTPRRASSARLSAITALKATDAHGQDDLRPSIRMDWWEKEALTWIELEPQNPRGLYSLHLDDDSRNRLVVSLRRHIYNGSETGRSMKKEDDAVQTPGQLAGEENRDTP
jgi:hypothetical protein